MENKAKMTSIGYPGLGRGTSPGWHSMFNEAILAWRYLTSKGLMGEFEKFKEEYIPIFEKEILENRKKLGRD